MILQHLHLVSFVTTIQLQLVDLKGDALVLCRGRDVFDHLPEEAQGPDERYEVELLGDTLAAFLKYSLSSISLAAALPAASAGVSMEKFAADHRLARIELHYIVFSPRFALEKVADQIVVDVVKV